MQVFKGHYNETEVAVKRLDDLSELMRVEGPEAGAALLASLKDEAGLMAALRHPNIVSFMGMCSSPPCIITEFCAKGSLTDVLKAAKHDPASLPWKERVRMAKEAATGMLHLHCQVPPIIHRDLKSPNLLVDIHGTIKVADVGLSKMTSESGLLSSGKTLQNMNPRWLAPEVMNERPASVASDVFAFGVVMWGEFAVVCVWWPGGAVGCSGGA